MCPHFISLHCQSLLLQSFLVSHNFSRSPDSSLWLSLFVCVRGGEGGSRAVCITEDNQWMTPYYPASKRLICLKPQMPTNPKCQSQMMWELVLARVKLPSCGVLGGGPGRDHLLLESAQPSRNTDQAFVLFVYPEDCHVCDHLRCGCCQK